MDTKEGGGLEVGKKNVFPIRHVREKEKGRLEKTKKRRRKRREEGRAGVSTRRTRERMGEEGRREVGGAKGGLVLGQAHRDKNENRGH